MMRRSRRSATCLVVTALVPILTIQASSSSEAGLITNHTEVRVYGTGSAGVGADGSSSYDSSLLGESSAQLSMSGTGSGNGVQEVSSLARTSLHAGKLIAVEAKASDSGGDNYISAGATAIAAWRDILFYHSAAAPTSLYLEFNVHGFFSTDVLTDYTAVAAKLSPNIDSLYLGYDLAGTPSNYSPKNGTQYVYKWYDNYRSAGFSNPKIDPLTGEFSGTISFEAPFDPQYGGYTFNLAVGVAALSGPADGNAETLFGNTIELSGVAMADGTTINSSDITFDSGLELAGGPAVPEPESLLLFAFGAVGLTIFFYRQRVRCTHFAKLSLQSESRSS